MKTRIHISYSRNNMDTWDEGRKTYLTVDAPTSVPLKKEAVNDLARAYLKAIEADYRDAMFRIEEINT